MKCSKCGDEKSPASFSKDRRRVSGYFPWCKSCQQVSNRTRAEDLTDAPLNGSICPGCDAPVRGHANRRFCGISCKDLAARLRKRFNLTLEQYRALVDATGGMCPICAEETSRWNVEHNHATGVVYGVVCTSCNVGVLAGSKHDVELARRLLRYLENPPARDRIGDVVVPAEQESKLHTMWSRAA